MDFAMLEGTIILLIDAPTKAPVGAFTERKFLEYYLKTQYPQAQIVLRQVGTPYEYVAVYPAGIDTPLILDVRHIQLNP